MPTAQKLTDSKCRSARPRETGYKLFDGLGLYLWVAPTGSKTWRLAFRVDGKGQQFSFGPYPEVTLAQAREKTLKARAGLRDGIRPARARIAPVRVSSLGQVYAAYWEKRSDVTPAYRRLAIAAFDNHIQRTLGTLDIRAIDRPALLACLLDVDAKDKRNLVRKLRMWLEAAWSHAVEIGLADVNVPATISAKKAFTREVKGNFPAIEPSELPALWARIAGHWDERARLLCRFQALTWVRPDEARLMPRDGEVQGDLWVIPAARMKKSRDHIVPLSAQALECLEDAKRWNHESEWMFPAIRTYRKPAQESTVLNLIHDVGYKGRHTAHGWRSMASTWANDRGYSPDVIEAQLAHQPGDKTRAAYNRSKYLTERRRLLADFGEWFEAQTTGRPQGQALRPQPASIDAKEAPGPKA